MALNNGKRPPSSQHPTRSENDDPGQLPPFDIPRHLDLNLGPRDNVEHTVRLELTGETAVAALRKPWHRTQVHQVLSNGKVEITLKLDTLTNVTGVVLGCHGEAEVISPPALRAKLRATTLARLAIYEKKS